MVYMYRKYLFICWVNSSGCYMTSELFEPFKPFKLLKLSKLFVQVDHVESVRLLYELVGYKN